MSETDVPVVRLAELLGAVSLATDLGTGQHRSHGLRTAVLAVALGRELGLDDAAVAEVRQVALLRFLGCTADSSDTAVMTGGDEIAFLAAMAPVAMGGPPEQVVRLVRTVGAGRDPLSRARLVAGALTDPGGAKRSLSAHCEVAALLAERLGVSPTVREALAHGHERWDGAGFPDGLAAEAIPLPVRLAVVARDADLWWQAEPSTVPELLRRRRGRAYDPAVADVCATIGAGVLAGLDQGDPWTAVFADDSSNEIGGDALDTALGALADFADLKSRWTRGHSTRVADLAAAAAEDGAAPGQSARLRRAGLVHDLGRVGVPAAIWDRPGPLGVADWERVRLHPYLSERVLARCPGLASLGRLAAGHHERLDGSGYHLGSRELDGAQRLLAAADVVAALGEARPHRTATDPARIPDLAAAEVRAGRLDRLAVDAVLAAAEVRAGRVDRPVAASGNPRSHPGRSGWPAGLSDREVEVLRLITRGRTNREVAATLTLSAKTVGRHVENIYAKIGVRSRAGAAVFAMRHRLLEP
ncbi:MAG TPA: HD domain-containing phosphohydrolase [Pseudonocardiaceae bacterium]|nr:HD domain-containing phosphohydrolase [Pseudonocardiaceae bacterium]